MDSGYILVYTTSCAFLSEEVLKNAGMNIKLVPTPRQFSSDCGISVQFENENLHKIVDILNSNNIEFEIKLL